MFVPDSFLLLYIYCIGWVCYLWSQNRGSTCASFLNLWSHLEKLQKYNTFLCLIEDISVIKCSNYNNLQGKTLPKQQKYFIKCLPCEGHWGYTSTYIYTNTQKWFFEGWQTVALVQKYAWQTLFFGYNCGAGAGQLNF